MVPLDEVVGVLGEFYFPRVRVALPKPGPIDAAIGQLSNIVGPGAPLPDSTALPIAPTYVHAIP